MPETSLARETVGRRVTVLAGVFLMLTMQAMPCTAAAQVLAWSVDPDGEAYRAGLRPADIIASVRLGGSEQPLDHPLRLRELEFLTASGQPVALGIVRSGQPLAVTISTMDWQVVASEVNEDGGPVVPGSGAMTEQETRRAWRLIDRLNNAQDAEALSQLAARLESSSELDARWRAELLLLAGEALHGLRHDQAQPALTRAAELFKPVLPLRALDLRLQLQAQAGLRRPLTELRADLQRLAQEADALPPSDLIQARLAHLDGFYTSVAGDLMGGAERFEQARAIYSRIAPHHPLHAQMHNNLGINARRLGNYASALAHYRTAAAIADGENNRERLLRAQFLNNQGVVARNQGDLVTADAAFRQSDDLRRAMPGLSVGERIAPLGNRVNVALDRLELDRALRLQLELIEMLADLPPSEHHGASWHGLGSIYLELEQPQLALEAFTQSLEAHESLAPAPHRTAPVILGLGRALAQLDDHAGAIDRYHEGLALLNAAVPDGIFVARAHLALAESLAAENEWSEAAVEFGAAAQRFSAISPHSAELALAHYGVARSRVALGQSESARAAFEQAIEAIEAQMLVLGGSRATLARYRNRFESIYKTYAHFLLEQQASAQVMLALMERYRTQRAVRQLQSRELDWQAHLSDELAGRLSQFQPRFDSALARLERAAGDPQARQVARDRLQALREERDELLARVRTEAPRAAAIRFPQSESPELIARQLPPATALVSFLVLPDAVLAVLMTRQQSSLVILEVEATKLQTLATRFGDRIALGQRVTDDTRLHELLIKPLLQHLDNVERLVMLTDGPLNSLPLAALWDGKHYLVERFTLAYADSLAGLHSPMVGSQFDHSVVLFEPTGPAAEQMPPLPYASEEAGWILDLLKPAEAWRGSAASELRVDQLGGDLKVLHFATHASVNPVWPMESYLLLSDDATHNGRLQAWEIFNRLRFNARLVTLSGCATDAGVPAGGEGLMGFTQAFRYAGARNVLASLWAVGDRSTAVLMQRFYQAVAAGQSLDQALATAQRALLAAPVSLEGLSLWQRLTGDGRLDARAPLHWAAFRLNVGEVPAVEDFRSAPVAGGQSGQDWETLLKAGLAARPSTGPDRPAVVLPARME